MNLIATVVTWVKAHWADVGQIWLQIIGAASILVRLTPTLKDDDTLKGIIRFVGKYLALNTTKGTTPNA